MDTISTELLIGAGARRVWAVLSDLATYPEWNPYMVRVEGTLEEGAELLVHLRPTPGAEPVVGPALVRSVEPPRAMRWEGGLPDRSVFRGDHWFVLEEEGGCTRFLHGERFTGSAAPAWLARNADGVRANFERFNRALKARTEA